VELREAHDHQVTADRSRKVRVALASARAARDVRKWWPHRYSATLSGRCSAGGMTTLTTGMAVQQHACAGHVTVGRISRMNCRSTSIVCTALTPSRPGSSGLVRFGALASTVGRRAAATPGSFAAEASDLGPQLHAPAHSRAVHPATLVGVLVACAGLTAWRLRGAASR
jgi:hypothetical protein